ncbi:MAG: trehalase family glycosidase [bacterium]
MQNYVYDIFLSGMNRTRRMFGSRWINSNCFGIETPDADINRAFAGLENELEARLSLPFGLRIMKNRWLQSTDDAGDASAAESALAAQFIKWFDPELALDIISPFFDNQSSEGIIPHVVKPLTISDIPAPSILIETALRISRMTGTQNISALFDRMERFQNWLILHRKEEDGMYSHGDREWFADDPYTRQLRAQFPESEGALHSVRPVALNSTVAIQMQCMSQIARSLKLDREARKYEEFAKQLCDNITAKLWHEEDGYFYDRVGDRIFRSATITGLLPLAADAPTKAQAARMVKRLPGIIENLNILIKQPDLAPAFVTAVEGLTKYGYRREAAALALEVNRYARSLGKAQRYFLPRLAGQILLVRNVIGFHQFDDRYVMHPCLPDSWAGGVVRIRNPKNSHTIILSLKDNNQVECRISSASGELFNAVIENYSFRNFPFKSDASIKNS